MVFGLLRIMMQTDFRHLLLDHFLEFDRYLDK